MQLSDRSRSAGAIAALVFGFSTLVAYLVERLFERLRSGKGVPRLIIQEAHVTFYWRTALAVWCGGLAAMIAYGIVMRSDGDAPVGVRRLTAAVLLLAPAAILWAWRHP